MVAGKHQEPRGQAESGALEYSSQALRQLRDLHLFAWLDSRIYMDQQLLRALIFSLFEQECLEWLFYVCPIVRSVSKDAIY